MFKSEKGSITIYVLGVMLFFSIILVGVLASSNNSRKNQKTAQSTVIDNYGKDVSMVNVIYNEKLAQYNNGLDHSDIAEVKWDGTTLDNVNFEADAVLNIYESDLSNISNFKYIVNANKEYIGENSNSWNSAQTVSNILPQGRLSPLQIENNKINFVHVLINYTSGRKIEIVSDGLRCQ